MLAFLYDMAGPDELRTLPSWKVHTLTGDHKGTWSLSVTANRRLTFRIDALVLAAFMRSNLAREEPGPRLDAISAALIQMGQAGGGVPTLLRWRSSTGSASNLMISEDSLSGSIQTHDRQEAGSHSNMGGGCHVLVFHVLLHPYHQRRRVQPVPPGTRTGSRP
jgi:hypothetical protein